MKKLIMSFLVFFGYVSVSWAVPVTFTYDSTTNASAVGGSSAEEVNVTFTFDSDILNGTGSFDTNPASGSYGPWNGTLSVGSDTVVLTGGDIYLWNYSSDGYDFRWNRNYANLLYGGTSSGTLFGSNLEFFRILIVDNNADMFSSVNLPTDPSFALRGDFIQDSYSLTTNGRRFERFGLSEFRSPGRAFTLSSPSPVPEPATILLLGTGIAALAGIRFRRKK